MHSGFRSCVVYVIVFISLGCVSLLCENSVHHAGGSVRRRNSAKRKVVKRIEECHCLRVVIINKARMMFRRGMQTSPNAGISAISLSWRYVTYMASFTWLSSRSCSRLAASSKHTALRAVGANVPSAVNQKLQLTMPQFFTTAKTFTFLVSVLQNTILSADSRVFRASSKTHLLRRLVRPFQ